MPSACIASLTTYSRSIGPTAAKPSPPRANGVAPEPLRCRSRAFAVRADELAEQQRAAVAEAGAVPAELMPGVGLCHRRRAVGDEVAQQEPQAVGAPQPRHVEAQFAGERLVEGEQSRIGSVGGLPRNRQFRQVAGEACVEDDGAAPVASLATRSVSGVLVTWSTVRSERRPSPVR